MSKVTIIDNAIEINKKHIEEFQLESEVGTKKMKESFHKNAVVQRNNYVIKEQNAFELYKKQVYSEMKKRVNSCYPVNNLNVYAEEEKYLKEFKKLITFTNDTLPGSYKMGFLQLISKIKEDDTSLDSINKVLSDFINKFKELSITLGIDDFSYTMFTKKYMEVFLRQTNDNVNLKDTFEEVYWECPDFIKHLKLNLWYILDKYRKNVDVSSNNIKVNLLNNYNITQDNVLSFYYGRFEKYDVDISRDSYINLNLFLDKKRNIDDYLEDSSIRKNNFNLLATDNDFEKLNDEGRRKYFSEIQDLSLTLPVLKKYYRYEFIVKDLQDKFSKRVENKNLYDNKLKEINKEEGKRKKIFSNYLRASGIGFLAKINNSKISSSKLEMNEVILKLYNLYTELHDLEIVYLLNKQLSEVSSLYDLFMTGYSSYFYLEKTFNDNFKDVENFSIEEEFEKYFDFIYSPYNSFLTKINGFVLCDVTEVVSDKYQLLELNVSKDIILKDTIDSTIDTVNYIKLVKDIGDGNLPLISMDFIVKFKSFEEVDVDGIEYL